MQADGGNAPGSLVRPDPAADAPSSTADSQSRDAGGLLVAFELAAHSPYTVDSSHDIHFDIAAEHITADTHPVPFATVPLPSAPSAALTLAQLRMVLQQSLQPATLVSMSAMGTLTPHQVLAVQSSRYAFLVEGQAVAEEAELHTDVAPLMPVLLLRVPHDVTDHASSPQTGTAATTPVVPPASSLLTHSPHSRPLTIDALQLPPPAMASGDGIHGGSGLDVPPISASSGSSGVSYSRASTLLMPHTRRASFDMSTHFDTLSLLDGSERAAHQQQQQQLSTTGMNDYHRHGLRPPRHNDRYVNEHSVRGSRTESANSQSQAVEAAADQSRGTPSVSLRRAATVSHPSRDSDKSDAEDEISPVDFPQSSAVRRRSSVHASASAPLTPPLMESPPQSNENTLSSSLPSTLGNFLGFLSKSSSATSPHNNDRALPRRQSLSAERRAYYNSMDAAPSLAHRRMSEAAAHQLTLTLKRGDIQRELHRAKSMETPPAAPARRTPAAVEMEEKRAEEQKGRADEREEEAKETRSGVSKRAISAIKRKLGMRKHSSASASKVKREGSQSRIHFADMMNEYSKSTANLHAPDNDGQQYRIVVIGERGDEREERKEETSGGGAEQARHRKNIVSDTTKLTTRIQPLHFLHAPVAASAPSRLRVYEDADAFLLSRPDEKREAQKSRVSTHRTDGSAAGNATDGRDKAEEMEPLWIAVEGAPNAVIQKVGAHFGLHPLTIEDCESGGIREKLEVFNDYLFIVFHALDQTDDDGSSARGSELYSTKHRRESSAALAPLTMPHAIAPSSSSSAFSFSAKSAASPFDPSLKSPDASSVPLLSRSDLDLSNSTPVKLVVFPTCVLTFHKRNLRCVAKVRRQLQKLYYNRLDNTAWVVHALLDNIVDSLIPVVGGACSAADALEDNIYMPTEYDASVKKRLLREMNLMGRRLAFLRQRMWSKRDILMSLIEKDWAIFLRGVKIPYLRDVYDHVETMLHRIDTSIEVVDTIQSTYLSIVNIDVSVSAENVNKAMKKMSAAATIILPLTLVSAIMGMNTVIPWQAAANLADPSEYPPSASRLSPFITLMGLFVLFTLSMFWYFKHIRYV